MGKMSKTKRRGFVMTGGGAKGLYEAGVMHAFHLTGIEFDVITGSSIGAMNSIFYAEYLFCKHQLPPDVQHDPVKAIESMDDRVKAFHHAWLMMPDKKVINDSAEGPLGRLKDDLLRFSLTVPQVTDLLWWWTDPDKGAVPPPRLWPHALRLLTELGERLGPTEVLRIFKHHRKEWLREALRTYFARFSLERSLVPDGEDNRIKEVFTTPISPLKREHLTGTLESPNEAGTPLYKLVDPERTLRDYARMGINVRLTRANYRTGRLEISAYVPTEEFACFLDKHAWRIRAIGPEKLPLGSFRLQLPGNPIAINAALCSGRFPGVFLPYRLQDIYPESDEENRLLYKLLHGWLADPEVEAEIQLVIQKLNPGPTEGAGKLADWKESQEMRRFFPRINDTYVDGGAIDNTPYRTAVDFVRDAIERRGDSMRGETLELYVVYLEAEPKVAYDEIEDPLIFEVVGRTLELVGAAKENSRANTFDTINTFGRRAEQLAQVLELVLDSYQETLKELDEAHRSQAEQDLRKRAQELGQRGFLGLSPHGILDRISKWTDETLTNNLPLHVEAVKIYPEEMPLGTLQFTERLGYKKDNAIQMITMGCYNTLDSLRTRLEALSESEGGEDLDEHDQRALTLARAWTGELWQAPDPGAPDKVRPVWVCQRTACSFYEHACLHGAKARQPAP